MSQTKLIMQMPQNLGGTLEIVVFADEFEGIVQFHQGGFSIAGSKKTAPIFERRSFWRVAAGEEDDQAQSDPGRDQIQEPFLRGLHDRWW